jgi:hypothetical protein
LVASGTGQTDILRRGRTLARVSTATQRLFGAIAPGYDADLKRGS